MEDAKQINRMYAQECSGNPGDFLFIFICAHRQEQVISNNQHMNIQPPPNLNMALVTPLI